MKGSPTAQEILEHVSRVWQEDGEFLPACKLCKAFMTAYSEVHGVQPVLPEATGGTSK